MYSGNPLAMNTMTPGVRGIMQGMGFPVNQGPLNPMREPEVAGMLQAPKPQAAQYPDIGAQANMIKGMQGLSQGMQRQGQGIVDLASQGGFQGPMDGGGNLNDMMARRGTFMQNNPLLAGFGSRIGMI